MAFKKYEDLSKVKVYARTSMIINLSLILSFILTSAIVSGQETTDNKEWKLCSNKDGLEIYTKSSRDSKIKQVKLVTTCHAPIEELDNILRDVTLYPDWVYKCKTAYPIKVLNNHERYYYAQYDFPFPTHDRDIVIHSKRMIDKQTGVIEYKSKAILGEVPEKKKMVRINEMTSHWKITPMGDETTLVEIKVHTNVGGSIPSWLINKGITKGPKNSISNLKKMLVVKPPLASVAE